MLIAIKDGVTIHTQQYPSSYKSSGDCILSCTGRVNLTKREAAKLGKILVKYAQDEEEN